MPSETGPVFAEPVFAEPWQAQAFAMVEHLRAQGVFTGSEWAAALATALQDQDADARGADYYEHWLSALETLLVERGVIERGALVATGEAWTRAAHATPHGRPIVLENDPEGAGPR